MRYVLASENGLRKVTVVDGWEFCIQYRPHDHIVLMENRGDIRGANAEKRKDALKGSAWFNISIRRADNSISALRYGVATEAEYDRRLNYYLNEAVNDIRLLYGNDTLHPTSYLFENNYNLAPQETMVVGFSLPGGDEVPRRKMRLSLVDRVFNSGIINAGFALSALNNIPTLAQ